MLHRFPGVSTPGYNTSPFEGGTRNMPSGLERTFHNRLLKRLQNCFFSDASTGRRKCCPARNDSRRLERESIDLAVGRHSRKSQLARCRQSRLTNDYTCRRIMTTNIVIGVVASWTFPPRNGRSWGLFGNASLLGRRT